MITPSTITGAFLVAGGFAIIATGVRMEIRCRTGKDMTFGQTAGIALAFEGLAVLSAGGLNLYYTWLVMHLTLPKGAVFRLTFPALPLWCSIVPAMIGIALVIGTYLVRKNVLAVAAMSTAVAAFGTIASYEYAYHMPALTWPRAAIPAFAIITILAMAATSILAVVRVNQAHDKVLRQSEDGHKPNCRAADASSRGTIPPHRHHE